MNIRPSLVPSRSLNRHLTIFIRIYEVQIRWWDDDDVSSLDMSTTWKIPHVGKFVGAPYIVPDILDRPETKQYASERLSGKSQRVYIPCGYIHGWYFTRSFHLEISLRASPDGFEDEFWEVWTVLFSKLKLIFIFFFFLDIYFIQLFKLCMDVCVCVLFLSRMYYICSIIFFIEKGTFGILPSGWFAGIGGENKVTEDRTIGIRNAWMTSNRFYLVDIFRVSMFLYAKYYIHIILIIFSRDPKLQTFRFEIVIYRIRRRYF